MLYKILKPLAVMLAKFFFRLEVKGGENVPRQGGFILASNHLSYLDPVILGVASPRKLNFMARHDLFAIPVFSSFIRSLGAFPLRRDFADIASIKEALRRLRQAWGLVLFPEGSRAFDGLERKAEPGIGFIAAKSDVPVVPAYISGTQKALPRHARFIRLTKIRVYFGKPVYPEGSDNYEGFASRILQEIKRLGEMNPALLAI